MTGSARTPVRDVPTARRTALRPVPAQAVVRGRPSVAGLRLTCPTTRITARWRWREPGTRVTRLAVECRRPHRGTVHPGRRHRRRRRPPAARREVRQERRGRGGTGAPPLRYCAGDWDGSATHSGRGGVGLSPPNAFGHLTHVSGSCPIFDRRLDKAVFVGCSSLGPDRPLANVSRVRLPQRIVPDPLAIPHSALSPVLFCIT